jgi:hypothetical protein
MPAQWPNFINKVSAKLSSLSAESIDEFAVFLAGEYFNSVKTSQTMFGNIHQSGQKPVLEEGFKKAFKKIYEEEDVEFDSKFTNSKYADMFEKAPGPDTTFDTYCELEKWTEKNKDNLEKFVFYPLFPSTCPNPADVKPPVTGEIDSNLLEEASKPGEPERYITMTISGFTEGLNYKFLYSINGEDQPLQIATDNVLHILAPTQNGSYVYVFKGVYADDSTLLKEINKTITLDIKPEGTVVIEEVKDPFADIKPRPSVPVMTEDERAKNIALRVVYQNDGSSEYGEWVDRLDIGINPTFGKKVKKHVQQILGLSSNNFDKLKDDLVQRKALEKAKKYRNRLIDQFNKQGSQFSPFGITKADIERLYNSELKKYQKEYKGKITENDIVSDMLKADKTLKREDALKKLYAIPIIDTIKNPINQYIFQEEHIDNKTRIPSWLEAEDICKFVFVKSIDQSMEGYSDRGISIENVISVLDPRRFEKAEIRRNTEKILQYLLEKNKWYDLLRKWGNSMTGNLEEDTQGGDGYEVMAQAIIDYWKSTAVQPFKPGPPITPCTSIPPLGGKYTPISYGNKSALASDLRKAWNTGKRFKRQPLTPVASKAVASAVATACAKHLLGVKFLYLGGFIVPSGPPIPMVGISPTTF